MPETPDGGWMIDDTDDFDYATGKAPPAPSSSSSTTDSAPSLLARIVAWVRRP